MRRASCSQASYYTQLASWTGFCRATHFWVKVRMYGMEVWARATHWVETVSGPTFTFESLWCLSQHHRLVFTAARLGADCVLRSRPARRTGSCVCCGGLDLTVLAGLYSCNKLCCCTRVVKRASTGLAEARHGSQCSTPGRYYMALSTECSHNPKN